MTQRRAVCVCMYVICLGVVVAGIGCGKGDANRGVISGEVKLDGQILERGSILFRPMEGTNGSEAGGPITSGRYHLSGRAGAAIGWNRVEIRAARRTGRMLQKPMAPQGEMSEEMVEAIPPQFNSESTLKVEIKPGDNNADFVVSAK